MRLHYGELPLEIENVQSPVHAIHEDKNGRLWFACTSSLVLFDKGVWKEYPFPDDKRSSYNSTQSLCSLPDGRLAIQTRMRRRELLIFNPQQENFDIIAHIPNRKIRHIAARPDGGLLLQTGDEEDFRLETFDGTDFSVLLDSSTPWGFTHIRYLYEKKNGDLLIGGTDGLALYRNGAYRVLPIDRDNGAFCIEETADGTIWIGGRDKIVAITR